MESRHDSENAERILRNINPTQLVSVVEQAYTKVPPVLSPLMLFHSLQDLRQTTDE